MASIRVWSLRAALALAAGLAAGLLPATARAGGGVETRDLRAPEAVSGGGGGEDHGSRGDGARGEIRAKETTRKRTLDLRVEGLEARRGYVVRDGDERDVGRFRTNRRGRGRSRLTERLDRSGQALGARGGLDDGGGDDGTCHTLRCDGGDDGAPGGGDGDPGEVGEIKEWWCVQVFDEETGECVLVCDDGRGGDRGDDVLWGSVEGGYAAYEGAGGWNAFASLFRTVMGEASYEDFALGVVQFDEETYAMRYWDFYANGATGLPLGVASVKDLAGRKFEARTADGDVVVEGRLPSLESMGEFPYGNGGEFVPMGGGVVDGVPSGGDRPGDGNGDDGGKGEEPWNGYGPPEEWLDGSLVLFVENDDGALEEIGSFVHYPDDLYSICPVPGEDDGHANGGDGSDPSGPANGTAGLFR